MFDVWIMVIGHKAWITTSGSEELAPDILKGNSAPSERGHASARTNRVGVGAQHL
jgi:hypothetical protein